MSTLDSDDNVGVRDWWDNVGIDKLHARYENLERDFDLNLEMNYQHTAGHHINLFAMSLDWAHCPFPLLVKKKIVLKKIYCSYETLIIRYALHITQF